MDDNIKLTNIRGEEIPDFPIDPVAEGIVVIDDGSEATTVDDKVE